MDKRVVDSGRVGERAKEALGGWLEWLEWLVNDASLGLVSCQCAGRTAGMEGRWCPEKGAKRLNRSQICWNTW